MLIGKGADQAAEQCHEQRGPHALVAHIADHQSDALAVGDGERIVEIAGHFSRCFQPAGDLPPFRLRQMRWQKTGLNAAADREFTLGRFFRVLQVALCLLAGGDVVENAAEADRLPGFVITQPDRAFGYHWRAVALLERQLDLLLRLSGGRGLIEEVKNLAHVLAIDEVPILLAKQIVRRAAQPPAERLR